MPALKLKPHQERCAEYLLKEDVSGLLLNHGMGTGKTLTSIAAFERLRAARKDLVAHVCVPAKLKGNYRKELLAFGVSEEDIRRHYQIFSHGMYAVPDPPSALGSVVLIIDEAHLLRNATSKTTRVFLEASRQAYKVLCLTGTPFVNYPNDMCPLIKMVNPGSDLPMTKGQFKAKFVRYEYDRSRKWAFPFYKRARKMVINDKGGQFSKNFRGVVSCVPSGKQFFPTIYVHSKSVPMDPHQYKLYLEAEKETIAKDDSAKNALKKGKESSSSTLNTFLNKTRSLSNTVVEFESTIRASRKFKNVLQTIETENRFPVVVYSFFLDSGVLAFKDFIGDKYVTQHIVGGTNSAHVQQVVQQYNDYYKVAPDQRKVEVLLISGAAGFGLDLKCTAAIHILEPAWNKSNIDQVIGRGVRYKSHEALPQEQRFVNVYHWLSVIPRHLFQVGKSRPSADEYLYNMSIMKDALNVKFHKFLCDFSIESSGRPMKQNAEKIKKNGIKPMSSLQAENIL